MAEGDARTRAMLGPAGAFWPATVAPPSPQPLAGAATADVAIVGGGYTGLWTALALVSREPSLRVVVCEGMTCGFGASGRNGGFLDPSLTHGLANGVAHFPEEVEELCRLGAANYAALRAFLEQHGIDCDFEPTGMLDVATHGWQAAELAELHTLYTAFGERAELLDRSETRAEVESPRFLAGLHRPDAGGLVNPMKLTRELKRVAEGLGVTVHEGTRVERIERHEDGVRLRTARGAVTAGRAVLATNAYSGAVLGRTRRHYVPVYDYVLVSEPLTPAQRAAVGWSRRQGLADAGNQFHYFRLTPDDRILWGGYDAVYFFGGRPAPRHDDHEPTYALLERQFATLFPALAGLAFPHRWGGPIATTTRFTPVFGHAVGGRVAYALGYTGLGIGASRFAAQVLADMLLEPASDLLRLRYVTSKPFPFPPEPARWAAVSVVRRALAKADRNEGRRGPVLRTLDRFGIGFDS
jgi:glycine/D-amino acid oxidase-like deaminating enzyme